MNLFSKSEEKRMQNVRRRSTLSSLAFEWKEAGSDVVLIQTPVLLTWAKCHLGEVKLETRMASGPLQ